LQEQKSGESVTLPVGLENIWGCHTLMTLSTPPVAMMFALTQ